jgi:electron transfer flavoprotein alpha/beta subunit
MNYLVLIKQVPNPDKKVGMKEDGTIDREKAEPIMNPFDANALEMALQLKEKTGGKITVISMGPPRAEEVVREAFGMGADEGYLLSDRAFSGADTWATANTIAKAIEKIGNYDLILCGLMAIDGDTAQVGPQVAERLEIPQVTFVEEIEINDDRTARFKRIVEGGYEIHLTGKPLTENPVLTTITNTANTPRKPSLMKMMKAKKMPVTTWTYKDLESDEENICRYGMKGSPTRVKKIETPEASRCACKMTEGKTASEAVECLLSKLNEEQLSLKY